MRIPIFITIAMSLLATETCFCSDPPPPPFCYTASPAGQSVHFGDVSTKHGVLNAIRVAATTARCPVRMLLWDPIVQKELTVSKEQESLIASQGRQYVSQLNEVRRINKFRREDMSFKDRQLEDRDALQSRIWVAKLTHDYEARLLAVLTDKQLRRLLQLCLQLAGPRAYCMAFVVDALSLNEKQQGEIQKAMDNMSAKTAMLFAGDSKPQMSPDLAYSASMIEEEALVECQLLVAGHQKEKATHLFGPKIGFKRQDLRHRVAISL